MRKWNPEENYIWIEPNVKFLLTNPDSYQYAPLPYYERPPPRPHNAPPPADKLRFVSTRRLYNSFETGTPWQQSVADDLDSFSQTLIHALLFRRVKEMESVPKALFSKLGIQTVHYLKEWRDEAEQVFWRISEKAKEKQRMKEMEGRGKGAPEGTSANAEGKDKGAGSMKESDAVVGALYKLLGVNATQWWKEQELARLRHQDQEKERVSAQYEKYREAMETVRDAAEVALRKRETRKAEKKLAEKKKEREEEAMTGEELKEPEDAVREAGCENMECDQEGAKEEGGHLDAKSASEKRPGHPNATEQAQSEAETSDKEAPPRKRIRTE